MTLAVHPNFKDSTRGDLLAHAKRVTPLRLHPYQTFSDFAITWRDVGNQGADLTPTGALRDFATMQAARSSFRAREMTTKDVIEHLQGSGLEVANLGVSAAITCEPFGPGRGRYLGVVSQRRADFISKLLHRCHLDRAVSVRFLPAKESLVIRKKTPCENHLKRKRKISKR